jgi:hypothetical protein
MEHLLVPIPQYETEYTMKLFRNTLGSWLIILAISAGIQPGILSALEIVREVAVDTSALNQDETSIAVHPLYDSLLVAAWNARYPGSQDWNIGCGFSTDGGLSWDTGIIPDVDEILVAAGDPSCVVDDSSYAYFCHVAHESGPYSGPIYIARTNSLGQNWDFYKVSGDQTYGNDRPYIAADNSTSEYHGYLYVAWLHREGYPAADHYIEFSYSSSRGESWSQPFTLDLGYAENNETVTGALPCVGIDGTVYVAWLYLIGGESPEREVRVSRSTDGGATFSDPGIAISSSNLFFQKNIGLIKCRSWPTITADQSDTNTIYLSYLAESGSDDANVYFIKSTDQGETWSNPVIPAENVAGIQYHPWLSCSPEGILYLIYGDIPDPQESLTDIYTVISIDRGETFLTPNIKVNSVSSDPNIPGPAGNDYQGIASTTGKAFPCWTDYRNGNEDIYCAIVDVFRSGEVDTDESWSQLVVMTGDVTVSEDDTLSIGIESGTESTTIYSIADYDDQGAGLDTARCELIIEGALEALGGASTPILFTATDVDASGGGWYGLRLKDGPDLLEWCEVRDAYIGVRSEGSTSTLSNCSLLFSELSGVGSSPGSTLSISGSFFEGNEEYAIGLLRPLYAEITGNDFYGNGDYGIYVTAGDNEESEVYISDNLIQAEAAETTGYDYGIYFRLVNNGSGGPTHLEITDGNEVSDCLQAGITVDASASLTPLDSLSVIENSITTDNYNGIEIYGGKNLVLTLNSIISNENKGIFSSHRYPILGDVNTGQGRYNSIYDNGVYDVYVQTNTPNYYLKAQMNWWGDSGGPDTDKLFGNILYDPWLSMAP